MLHHDVEEAHALLLVLVDDDYRLVVVWHVDLHDGAGILRVGDSSEHLAYLRLGVVDVDVAHNDDSLVRRMVPFLVVVAQFLRLEVVDYLHRTYRIAVSVLRTGVQRGQVTLEHSAESAGAQAPLLVDHSPLLVYLFRLEQQSVGPVVEDEEAGVERFLARRRHIIYIIYSLLDGGVGVEVVAELHSDGAAVFYHFVVGEVVGAVEAHVLKEVCQSALAVLLLQGAHFLGYIEVGAVLGPVVVTDVVGQSVVELSNPHCRVDGQSGHLHLCLHRRRSKQQQCYKEISDSHIR